MKLRQDKIKHNDKTKIIEIVKMIDKERYTMKEIRKKLNISSNYWHIYITDISFIMPIYEIEIYRYYKGVKRLSDIMYRVNRIDCNYNLQKLIDTLKMYNVQ